MSLARIIVLSVLFYILYQLLFGRRKKAGGGVPRSDQAAGRIQDVLVEDPVCHTYIAKNEAVVLEQRDKTLHFCSTKCRDEFVLEQQKRR